MPHPAQSAQIAQARESLDQALLREIHAIIQEGRIALQMGSRTIPADRATLVNGVLVIRASE